jgi:signal transduction histidine kinase
MLFTKMGGHRLSQLKLRTQLILLLGLAVFLAQVLSVYMLSGERELIIKKIERYQLLETLSNTTEFLNELTQDQQEPFLQAVNRGRFRGWLSDQPYFQLDLKQDIQLKDKLEQLFVNKPNHIALYTGSYWETIECNKEQNTKLTQQRWVNQAFQISLLSVCEAEFFSSIKLQNGRWINNAINLFQSPKILNSRVKLNLALTLILIIAIVTGLISRLTRPLRRLAEAAEKSGKGDFNVQVTESGPYDVRQAISSFNKMQERIQTFVESRTRLLAAISHDLRTPITSMQLRVELLDHPEAPALLRTLKEMEDITNSSLDFFRVSSLQEEIQPVDLTSLVSSVCDDIASTGRPVTYDDTRSIVYNCRQNALRRVISNLIENAVNYGKQAHVNLSEESEKIFISVFDKGQGIAPELQQQVFEPFFRIDQARSNHKGSTGLGLSIAHNIVKIHGGDIQFHQSDNGFEARIVLPK